MALTAEIATAICVSCWMLHHVTLNSDEYSKESVKWKTGKYIK